MRIKEVSRFSLILFIICMIAGGIFIAIYIHESTERRRRFENGFAETSRLYSSAVREALELSREELEIILAGEFVKREAVNSGGGVPSNRHHGNGTMTFLELDEEGEQIRRSVNAQQWHNIEWFSRREMVALTRLSEVRVYPLHPPLTGGFNTLRGENERLIYTLKGRIHLGFFEGTLASLSIGIEHNEMLEQKIYIERQRIEGNVFEPPRRYLYREHLEGSYYMFVSLYTGQMPARNLLIGLFILFAGLVVVAIDIDYREKRLLENHEKIL